MAVLCVVALASVTLVVAVTSWWLFLTVPLLAVAALGA